jgi:hypothetical protein
MIKMVKLKTGKSVPEPVVATTMMAIKTLVRDSWSTLSELSWLCEDSKYKIHNTARERLKALSLMQPDGSINDDVCEIVLSAVIWDNESYTFTIVSPIADPD